MSAEKNHLSRSDAEKDLEAQDSLLQSIKTANAVTMTEPVGDEHQSITGKTRECLGIQEGQAAELMISVGAVKDEEDKVVGERIWIRAEAEEKGQKVTKFIPAAREFEGLILPEGNFTDEEALVLSAMIKGLRQTKESGQLPALCDNLSFIDYPSHEVRKLPGIEE